MKTKLKFIIPVIIISLLLGIALFYISDWKKPEDINRIEIHSEYGFPHETYEYIIDFTDNTIKTHSIDSHNEEENNIIYFSDEEKEKFVRQANSYGFFDWEELYERKNVEDGLYKTYYIIYNDGSRHETTCANDYPSTYEGMQEVFRELFGIW